MGGGGGGGSVGALLGLLLIVANLPCHVLIQRDHAKWGSDVAIKAHRISMRSMTAVGGCPARGSSIGEQGSLQRGDSDGDEEADVSHARLGHASCDDLVPFAGCGGQGGSSAGGNLGMVVGRLRGGASREEVERKMREEREREAQLQEELRERQLKRKQEKGMHGVHILSPPPPSSIFHIPLAVSEFLGLSLPFWCTPERNEEKEKGEDDLLASFLRHGPS
jgi:hypothetical protein